MRNLLLLIGLTLILSAKTQTIVFAAGCFWGVEKHFEHLPGVTDAVSGYAGGNYPDPDYDTVLKYRHHTPKGITNYAESVKVTYDDDKISTEDLIKSFWELHDPTQGYRQGNDRGDNYRSAVYYTTPRAKAYRRSNQIDLPKAATQSGLRHHHHRDQTAKEVLLRRGVPPELSCEKSLWILPQSRYRGEVWQS